MNIENTRPDLRLSRWFGWGGSVLIHLFVFGALVWSGAQSSFDFKLQLPTHVEFGFAESLHVAQPEAPLVSKREAIQPESQAEKNPSAAKKKPSFMDAGISDAGLIDGDTAPDAGTEDASNKVAAEETSSDAGIENPTLAIPAGALIALRINMAMIRESDLAQEVRHLLTAIPDWQALLEGSGIDPIEDLDRLLIASPDLSREKAVFAGQHRRDPQYVHDVVQRMADRRGASATWRQRRGVWTAPWPNADATERVIGLIGNERFVIARATDVSKVLAWKKILEERAQAGEQAGSLLDLPQGEALSIEVEGARRFALLATGRESLMQKIPTRLRAHLSPEGGHVHVQMDLLYEDPEQAALALEWWRIRKERWGQSLVIGGILDYGKPLRDGTLEISDSHIQFRATVPNSLARLGLNMLRDWLTPAHRP